MKDFDLSKGIKTNKKSIKQWLYSSYPFLCGIGLFGYISSYNNITPEGIYARYMGLGLFMLGIIFSLMKDKTKK